MAACDTVKRVPDGKRLLKKNEILVNDKIEKDESISNLLYQKPNSTFLGYNLRLNMYNLAKENPDSQSDCNVYKSDRSGVKYSNDNYGAQIVNYC